MSSKLAVLTSAIRSEEAENKATPRHACTAEMTGRVRAGYESGALDFFVPVIGGVLV